MAFSPRETLKSIEMAKALGISQKLLLLMRKQKDSPFQQGKHYRFQGISTLSPVSWFPIETDEAFTTYQRIDPPIIETMEGVEGVE